MATMVTQFRNRETNYFSTADLVVFAFFVVISQNPKTVICARYSPHRVCPYEANHHPNIAKNDPFVKDSLSRLMSGTGSAVSPLLELLFVLPTPQTISISCNLQRDL